MPSSLYTAELPWDLLKSYSIGFACRCFAAEGQTDALINELMASNARHSDPQRFLEDMERERREMEERFTIKAGEADKLREQEVLSACSFA